MLIEQLKMVLPNPIKQLCRGFLLLLQKRCDGPFAQSGILRPIILALNSLPFFRCLLKCLFRITHPVKAVVIGDRNTSFYKYGWLTLNLEGPADYLANIRKEPLPFADESLGYLYVSHVLEHLNDQDLEYVLSEFIRVLSPEGFIRIVVPDLDLFVRSFNDDALSLHFDRPASDFTAHSVRDGLLAKYPKVQGVLEPHNGLINVVASFTNGNPPLQVSRSEFDQNFSPDNLDGFISWAVNLKPPEEDFGHCNGFNFTRLSRFLRAAGFDRVSHGFYNDPFTPKRMNGLDLANKQHISLYVNAARS